MMTITLCRPKASVALRGSTFERSGRAALSGGGRDLKAIRLRMPNKSEPIFDYLRILKD